MRGMGGGRRCLAGRWKKMLAEALSRHGAGIQQKERIAGHSEGEQGAEAKSLKALKAQEGFGVYPKDSGKPLRDFKT